MQISRRLLACAVALAAATTAAPATATAGGPEPTYWQGSYGPTEFYGRQFLDDANPCKEGDRDLIFEVADVVREAISTVFPPENSGWCMGLAAAASDRGAGSLLAELIFCADWNSPYTARFEGRSYEVDMWINDSTTRQTVRTWAEPTTVDPYTLDPGDCAVYAWHLDLVTDAGTPFVSGREYVVWFDHPDAFEPTASFVAP